jgi:ribosomal protein L35AE/L33A
VITKTKFDKRMVNKKPVVQPYRRSDHKEIPSYNLITETVSKTNTNANLYIQK